MLAEHQLTSNLICELVMEAGQILRDSQIADARLSADWLSEAAFGMSRVDRLLGPDARAGDSARKLFRSMVERRMRREPVQYILGRCEFMGLPMNVRPGVLIPRPETETLVEYALTQLDGTPAPRVLDVGTGSGCIAISIKHARPDADVRGCDISQDALVIADENARLNQVQVAFAVADMLAPATLNRFGRLDMIVSNPPYVPDSEAVELEPEVLCYEPGEALFSGEDPQTYYRAIAETADTLLKPGGVFVVETHAEHARDTREIFRAAGFTDVALKPDLAGRLRIAAGRKV